MAAKTNLRAVEPDEKPPAKSKPKTVTQAIDSSERDLLVALRSNIAADLDAGVPAHAKAGLTKQLLELDKAIRAIDLRAASEQEASGGPSNEGTAEEAFDSSAI